MVPLAVQPLEDEDYSSTLTVIGPESQLEPPDPQLSLLEATQTRVMQPMADESDYATESIFFKLNQISPIFLESTEVPKSQPQMWG